MKKGKVLEKTITVNGKKITHTYIFDRIKKGNLNPFLEAAHWVRKGNEWMGRRVGEEYWGDNEEGRKAGNEFYKALIEDGFKLTD